VTFPSPEKPQEISKPESDKNQESSEPKWIST